LSDSVLASKYAGKALVAQLHGINGIKANRLEAKMPRLTLGVKVRAAGLGAGPALERRALRAACLWAACPCRAPSALRVTLKGGGGAGCRGGASGGTWLLRLRAGGRQQQDD
jgi:hypothetical protein